nr:hypothetical protein [Tanacetum cinerariifolium]
MNSRIQNESSNYLNKIGQLFWGFEVKVVGCSKEQWEWRETGGLGFTGFGGKSVVGTSGVSPSGLIVLEKWHK